MHSGIVRNFRVDILVHFVLHVLRGLSVEARMRWRLERGGVVVASPHSLSRIPIATLMLQSFSLEDLRTTPFSDAPVSDVRREGSK